MRTGIERRGDLSLLSACCLALCTVMAFAPLATTPAMARPDDAPAFQPLFNGKDLTGWEKIGGGQVRVEKGILILEHDDARKPGYLICTHPPIRDFELRLRCRISEGDSGLFFRGQRHPLHAEEFMGPQVQLNVQPRSGLGGIFEHHGRGWVKKTPAEQNAKLIDGIDWFDVVLHAEGPRLYVRVNGQTTIDFEDRGSENHFQRAGAWALQIHGGCRVRAEWQRIDYRPLSARKAPT